MSRKKLRPLDFALKKVNRVCLNSNGSPETISQNSKYEEA
jgi:hypothetical protein